MKKVSVFIGISVLLGLCVVMLGAYTRLTDAGLGCPDWPGCYGKMVLPQTKSALTNAQAAFPEQPIESRKAWTEMAHRYLAGTLGLCIFSLFIIAWFNHFKGRAFPILTPTLLILLLVCQALLGMWTVTLKLLPIVVAMHLLGGMLTVSLLFWTWLTIRMKKSPCLSSPTWLRKASAFGVGLVFFQIFLGAWVSANYAGIACTGFPGCNGSWPALNLLSAFKPLLQIGPNYQGGVLDIGSRITIQWIHRLGALLVFTYWLLLSVFVFRIAQIRVKRAALVVLGLLLCQLVLGIVNVIYLLPLSIAVLHNGVALLLLLSTLALYRVLRPMERMYV